MEWKTIDSGPIGPTAVPTAGSLTLLNGVAQGVAFTERVGRVMHMTSILLRLFITPDTTTSSQSGDFVRAMIVYDSQSNSAAPAIADILSTASFSAPNNLNNRERFLILRDQFFPLTPTNYSAGDIVAGDPEVDCLEIAMNLGLDTVFSGTGSTIASIQTGSLFLLLISANATYSCLFNSRVRFVDS